MYIAQMCLPQNRYLRERTRCSKTQESRHKDSSQQSQSLWIDPGSARFSVPCWEQEECSFPLEQWQFGCTHLLKTKDKSYSITKCWFASAPPCFWREAAVIWDNLSKEKSISLITKFPLREFKPGTLFLSSVPYGWDAMFCWRLWSELGCFWAHLLMLLQLYRLLGQF